MTAHIPEHISIDMQHGTVTIDGHPLPYPLLNTTPRIEADKITTVWLPFIANMVTITSANPTT